jgi:hypothetical protein
MICRFILAGAAADGPEPTEEERAAAAGVEGPAMRGASSSRKWFRMGGFRSRGFWQMILDGGLPEQGVLERGVQQRMVLHILIFIESIYERFLVFFPCSSFIPCSS